MLLLVTDTSGKNGSVALARSGSDDGVKVIESVPLAGGTFSAQLVPQIAALLAKHGFRKTDIGAFIVVSGPGSFTGLRVGLAAIKALAEILGKPIVPVSLLEVVAAATNGTENVFAVLDAGRGEVYAGEYDISGGTSRLVREQLVRRDEFVHLSPGSTVATPDAGLAEMARQARRACVVIEHISAEMIARLGWRRLQAGESIDPERLDANYIRRSDAEIFAKPASSS